MGRLEEYEQFLMKYQELYGRRTVVLYQMGKFHELYGVDNEHEKVGNVTEISTLLGIKETRVNTNIPENNRQNPQMAGFNSVNLDERVDRLVNNGYVVVVVNQVAGSKPIRREVAYIESPATRTGISTAAKDPYLVSVYIDYAYDRSTQRRYSYIGMAAMDITTGSSTFYESASTPSDPILAEDDLVRFLKSFNPVEVVLNQHTTTAVASGENLTDLVHSWGYRLKDDMEDHSGPKPTVYTNTGRQDLKLAYQEEFLSRYFTDRGHLGPLEYLGMTQYEAARVAYIYLLDFCSTHNARILTGIGAPSLWSSSGTMVLDTNSIIQLGIIEGYYEQEDTVVSVLSKYLKTPMGRRLLRDRLVNPVIDPVELASRYRMIEWAMNQSTDFKFNKIRDLDRLSRRMALGVMTPAELYTLDQTLEIAKEWKLESLRDLNGSKITEVAGIAAAIQSAYSVINIEEAGDMDMDMQDSIFKVGYNSEIDELSSRIRDVNRVRDILCQKLSDLIASGSSHCKYKQDVMGQNCYCSVTKAQFSKLESKFPKSGLTFQVGGGRSYTVQWTDLVCDTRNKSNVKFSITLLDQLQEQQVVDIANLKQLSMMHYTKLLVELHHSIGPLIRQVSLTIANLDLYTGMAKLAKEYGYCKPEPVGSGPTGSDDSEAASLDAVRLRHPIVERGRTYVPQSISLGPDSSMLLYGVNQTGKSCTMKSVGVAIVMAQAGLYVPAQSFRFRPYRLLTTRILGNDSISRGLSTFAVEMIELRSILTRCNRYTLVLGDEVCHGTESASAVALVAASIRHMSQCGSSFIFATHLHELSKMDEVAELHNVKHYHLAVDFDGDQIVYNRVMLSGAGLGLYGIEVAKHLKLPSNVLEDAYRIRNKYARPVGATSVSEIRPSRYNAQRAMSVCKVPGCSEQASQTHHIRHQASDQAAGLVNNVDNLVPICDYHHDQVHGHGHGHGHSDDILVIFGYLPDGTLDCKVRKKISTLSS